MRIRSIALGLGLASLVTVVGCGDEAANPAPGAGGAGADGAGAGGSGGQGGGGGNPGPCTVLTPDDTMLDIYTGAIFSISARVDAPLADYAKTRLFLELYPTEATPWPEPGSYDLSLAPDDDYGTCEHCVLLVAYDQAGQPRRVFFQESGTMDLTFYDPEGPYTGAGTAQDVRLVELSQNEDGSWNVVPGGLCFDLPLWSFDTQIVNGGPCESAEDCPNALYQICDVETKTCQPAECSLFGDPPVCDAGFSCLSQYGLFVDRDEMGPSTGACYATCEPGAPGTSGSCDAGSTCLPLNPTQTFGVCLETGGPAVGEPCSPSDVATGCEAGALCAGEPPTCRAICNYLTAPSGCATGTYCSSLNLCEPLTVGDDAPVGALCEPNMPVLSDCGPEGDAFRGYCFSVFNEDPTCRRTCKTADPQCPGALACVPVFSNPDVGLCLDPGVCGDGKLDLYGPEYCDDGNTVSGDGCSADCSMAELGPLCSATSTLSVGLPMVDVNDGINGWLSLCDPFLAMPVSTYSFLPPAPGELRLELTSLPDLGLSVLSDCQDPMSELVCRSQPGSDVVFVNFPSVPPQPALVVVRGQNPYESGLFLLQSQFTVAVCGDGALGGPEACDDGNTASGDGCAGDCSAIEWPQLCASLPPLPTSGNVSGTLDGAPAFFDTTGICSYQSGVDRAYAFTAPSAGTLTVSLSSSDNLSVFIANQCGALDESSYVACSNFAPAGETEVATASLQAGQTVTVIVDGFTKDDAGAYTLTAAFSP